MSIRDLWNMWYDWHSKLEVHVYKESTMIYKGTYSRMSEDVLNANVYRFVMTLNCLVIFIMVNKDE